MENIKKINNQNKDNKNNKILKSLGILLDIIHLLLLFLPFIIFLTPVKYIKRSFKYIFLILILTPIYWDLFEDCLITTLSEKLGSYDDMNTEDKSLFSRKYLRWLYEPIMKTFFGWEWNNENISKISSLHVMENIILLWIYLFFIGGKKLI